MRYHEIKNPSFRAEISSMDGSSIDEDVFHGSPHKFKKFSMDQVGNGEGRSRFGWGLYFTDTEEVAEHYRTKLANQFTYMGRPVQPESWVHTAIYLLVKNDMDKDDAKETLRPSDKAYQLIDIIDVSKIGVKSYKYSVHIPDDVEYLLWDRPFSEQSQVVKTAVEELVQIPQEIADMKTQSSDRTVWDLMDEELRKRGKHLNGEEIYNTLSHQLRSKKAASLALLSKGVHGIKYLNGRSRDTGHGYYNYVIFDDALPAIKNVT